MNLVITIGNTNSAVFLCGKKCRKAGTCRTGEKNGRKSIRKILAGIPGGITVAAIVSVVPQYNKIWTTELNKRGITSIRFLNAATVARSLLEISYKPLGSLGADRIAGALGAVCLFPEKNRIVIDAGTAITVNAVSKKNEFLGGMIFPGPAALLQALYERTSLLPKLKLTSGKNAIGRTTSECMRLGVLHQSAGGIESAVRSIIKGLSWKNYEIAATGGGWRSIEKLISLPARYEPELAAEGANYWLEKEKVKVKN